MQDVLRPWRRATKNGGAFSNTKSAGIRHLFSDGSSRPISKLFLRNVPWDIGFRKRRWYMLAFFKNRCGNESFQEFYAEADHQHIIQLANDWDEIRDKLNRTRDIESRTSADEFGIPWNARVN